MTSAFRFVGLTIAFAGATWLAGWWSVPLVALVAGLMRWSPLVVAAASASGWLALLSIDFVADGMGRLSGLLAGIMGLPAPALYLATLLFPAMLGWSAASIANAARNWRSTSLPRS